MKVEDAYEDIKDELLEEIEEIQPAIRPLDTGFYLQRNSLLRKERKQMLQLIENDKNS